VRVGDDPRSGFLGPLVGDGRPLLLVVAGSLIFAGGFTLFLAAIGDFLPHDVHYLGMTADDLCAVQSCRIVDFMVHDRAAFGGTLAGLGVGATAVGGLVILRVGVGDTFVPEDLEFIGISAAELHQINPRLTSLLAHDRAGFGGGVLTMGLTTMLCLWCGRPSRHLHQAIALAGMISLGAAIGVHFGVGYTDVWHLLPALAGAASLLAGLALEHPGVSEPHQ